MKAKLSLIAILTTLAVAAECLSPSVNKYMATHKAYDGKKTLAYAWWEVPESGGVVTLFVDGQTYRTDVQWWCYSYWLDAAGIKHQLHYTYYGYQPSAAMHEIVPLCAPTKVPVYLTIWAKGPANELLVTNCAYADFK